ncbi:MAG: holo-ACP synthase [Candidatus Binatia bacterium]|nr:holo-ACP synthase [Candidatus Binatia bacterium]
MIIGVGNDLAEVERLRMALEHPQTGARLRDRVFTPEEQVYCEQRGRAKYQSYAARFAAKEATMKALGRGWGQYVGWREIEVVRRRGARPQIVLHGKAAVYAASLGIQRFHLALTHTATLAMAYVIAEGEGKEGNEGQKT